MSTHIEVGAQPEAVTQPIILAQPAGGAHAEPPSGSVISTEISMPSTTGIPSEVKLSDSRLYINRQLSWLAFNERVLAQARDDRHPLLERARFLAISETNLDEFYMIRVSGLRRQVAANRRQPVPDGISADDQLLQIHSHTEWFLSEQRRILNEMLLPALEQEGIAVLSYSQLRPREQRDLRIRFENEILPILTPRPG